MATRIRLREPDAPGGSYFANPKSQLDFINSGSVVLDCALGGGWAEGRIANIVGDKSTGKTLLCIEACANFANKYPKGRIRYRESEAAFDPGYAAALGMPVDRIDFGQPLETVEDLFEDLEKIVTGAKQDELVICDSLDALSDRGEIERPIDQGSYGAEKAKKMSQLFRRLVQRMQQKRVTLIIVSQIRDKIGISFGRKTTRSGGKALDFYASQVVYLAHLGTLTRTLRGTKRPTGIKVKAKLDKNKIALPGREAEFSVKFGYGVDDAQACIDWLSSIKRFKGRDFGIKPGDEKGHLELVLDMEPADAQAHVKALQEAVVREWYSIEAELMPVRTKYGT